MSEMEKFFEGLWQTGDSKPSDAHEDINSCANLATFLELYAGENIIPVGYGVYGSVPVIKFVVVGFTKVFEILDFTRYYVPNSPDVFETDYPFPFVETTDEFEVEQNVMGNYQISTI